MNGIYIVIGAILVVAIVLVTLLLLGRRGAGRLIECPECGVQFKRPAFTEKTVGFGPALPGIGNYTCPKCKHRARTSGTWTTMISKVIPAKNSSPKKRK